MSFDLLPLSAVLLGLAALALILVLLQRLRIRHRPVVVETHLFWREALSAERARVRTHRFRHPLTYLLLLAIASALWLAFAHPRSTASEDKEHVILLDASAGMARAGRFEAAVDRAERGADALPRDHRRVLLCADGAVTVLRPGEAVALLGARLAGVVPVAAPSCLDAALERARRLCPAGRTLDVLVAGDAPLPAVRDGETIARLTGTLEPTSTTTNRGITGLGAYAVASRLDATVQVRGAAEGPPTLEVLVDGGAWAGTPTFEKTADDGWRATLEGLPAEGGRLEVRLPGGDGLSLDDVATLRLPDGHRRTPVALEEDLPEALGRMVDADPGLVVLPLGAESRLVIRRAGSAFGGERPALELVSPQTQEDAVLLQHDGQEESAATLRALHEGLGLDRDAGQALAAALERRVTVGAAPAETRRVLAWAPLFEGRAARTRATPLLLAACLRWLERRHEVPVTLPVGHAAPSGRGVWTDEKDRAYATLGRPFRPPFAGRYGDEAGRRVEASLLDAASTRAPEIDADESRGLPILIRGLDATEWLVLLALLLLIVDWVLYRRGRIP